MIEVKNLVFNYPGNKHKVFDGLNLTLKENRIYGLLGKNGMGKSTEEEDLHEFRSGFVLSIAINGRANKRIGHSFEGAFPQGDSRKPPF